MAQNSIRQIAKFLYTFKVCPEEMTCQGKKLISKCFQMKF